MSIPYADVLMLVLSMSRPYTDVLILVLSMSFISDQRQGRDSRFSQSLSGLYKASIFRVELIILVEWLPSVLSPLVK